MKKFGFIPIIVIILTALLSAGLQDWTTQEVFNLVLVDSAGTRLSTTLYDYTTQEALNTVLDTTNSALLIRIDNVEDLHIMDTLWVADTTASNWRVYKDTTGGVNTLEFDYCQIADSVWINVFSLDSTGVTAGELEVTGNLVVGGTISADSLIISTVADSNFTVRQTLTVEGVSVLTDVTADSVDLRILTADTVYVDWIYAKDSTEVTFVEDVVIDSTLTIGGSLKSSTDVTTTDDFIFGSPQMDDDTNTNHDARMFFDKSKGAFRAGRVAGDEWDDANVGDYSFAEGEGTTASGNWSHAEGESTTASGNYSHTEGGSTTASGNYSHAEGGSTTASGYCSHAEGGSTTASGNYSHAEGEGTTAQSYASVAIGKYNVGGGTTDSWVATDPIFEVGDGADGSNKSNAFTIYKNGNTEVGGDIDNEGNYLLDNQSISNLSSKGAGYWFDGVDDYVTVADNDNLDFGTGDFSVVSIVQTGNDVTSDEQYIFQKHNARNSVTAGWDFFLSTGSDMTIYYADGTDRSQWRRGSGYELEINTNYILVFSLDKTANTVNIFQGGIDVGATEALGDLSTINNGVDNAVAALIGENTSAGEGWGGQIYSTKVFNLALDNTDSDDKAILNGAELPYKYIGASQTEHLDETDFATHDNWDVTNDFSDTVPGGNATYAWASNTTSTLTQVNGDMAVAPVGQKQYRLTYTCAVTTAPDGDFALTLTTGIAGTAVDLDFTAGTFNYEFETKHTPADFVISAVSGTDTEGTFSIDDISLIQIGCVANYTPEGIGNYTWQDVSGNELNGTLLGATPINLPADDEQIAIQLMADDATMTDAIPADYLLECIIVENQSATADTLDFGTSEWASDIVGGSVIAASIQTVIVLNKFYDAETDISVSDTNGNGWQSTGHIINAIVRRIK